MSEDQDIDVLAAEYVLGTLDAQARAAVAARRQRERTLNSAIEAWETRLAPLMETVRPIEPRQEAFSEIQTRIAVRQSVATSAMERAQLARSAQRWRRLAMAATAIAASLLVVIGVREHMRVETPLNYVAVFQNGDTSPAFLLSLNLETRELSIRPVAAQPQAGKSYQLWIASEKLGFGPQSLGLLQDRTGVTRRTLASYDAGIVATATFGISLEPEGGSPTGRPTGPAFHAKLIPAPR